MSTAGIIVEYNPFHNGHLYHIAQTKKITGCDYIVAVMSGNFVQRGEPAIINKWERTKMALLAGADLVIELPVIYSTSSAEGFAYGGVSLLDSLGIIDCLCFGSESGDINELNFIAKILSEEPAKYKELLKQSLKLGISYPAARQKALTEYMIYNNCENVNNNIEEIINNSNNILALEYLKAIYRTGSNIKPFTIRRLSSNYKDKNVTGKLSSAASIRANFEDDIIRQSMPDFSYSILMKEQNLGKCPVILQNYSDIILYKLRNLSIEEIRNLPDVEEGLEYKIKKACENTGNINSTVEYVINKRFPRTRIQRILIYSLLNITRDIQNKLYGTQKYIRVLGFNNNGKRLIKEIRSKTNIPVILNPGKENTHLLSLDVQATDIYVLGYGNSQYKQSKLDLKVPPVCI